MKLTAEQIQQLEAAAHAFSAMMTAWMATVSDDDKAIIVDAGLTGARLGMEYTPQPAPSFRMTMISSDGLTRVALAELPLSLAKINLQ